MSQYKNSVIPLETVYLIRATKAHAAQCPPSRNRLSTAKWRAVREGDKGGGRQTPRTKHQRSHVTEQLPHDLTYSDTKNRETAAAISCETQLRKQAKAVPSP